MSKSYAVLGLGRFGKKVAFTLYDLGMDVMVVDREQDDLEAIADHVTYVVQADLTNPDSIKGIGLENMDVVIVTMGSDLTASIMSVMVSKELGVKQVIAKAADERMGAILKKVGADKVIFPEEETGERVARKLMSDNFLEFFDIDDNLCLIEMKPKEEWIGKNLIELSLRETYSINVVAIKNKHSMESYIDPKKPLGEKTSMLIVVDKKDLAKLK